jgi:hypothetical protein
MSWGEIPTPPHLKGIDTMLDKLRIYIESCRRHADRLDTAETTQTFYNQAFGALMFAIDAGLITEKEGLDLWDVELYDTWAELVERSR